MADQNEIAPIKHSGTGAALNTAAGAGVGAVKKGTTWGLKWIGGFTAVGAVVGLAIATGGTSFLFSGFLWGPLIGAGVGLAAGTSTSWLPGGLGALFGGIEGGAKSSHRVKMERGAANAMEAQLDAYKYNAMAAAAAGQAQTNVYAPSATSYAPVPQGSAMNAAPSQIQTGGMQYDGLVNGQQLAAAR